MILSIFGPSRSGIKMSS